MTSKFVEEFERLESQIYALAKRNGFHDHELNVGEKIALMHSELSEALEAFREGNPPDDKVPEFDAMTVELADCIIRIMDLSSRMGLSLADAILAKHEFNLTRPYKHGKKF